MDKQFYELKEKFQEMQNQLEEEHKIQLIELKQKLQEKYNSYVNKPSKELINLHKKLEYIFKKKIIKMLIKQK